MASSPFKLSSYYIYINVFITCFCKSVTLCRNFSFSSFNFKYSFFKLSLSKSSGALMFFLINLIYKKMKTYSNGLFGLSDSSYKETRTFVSWSTTPVFSKYALNSSFFASIVYSVSYYITLAWFDILFLNIIFLLNLIFNIMGTTTSLLTQDDINRLKRETDCMRLL